MNEADLVMDVIVSIYGLYEDYRGSKAEILRQINDQLASVQHLIQVLFQIPRSNDGQGTQHVQSQVFKSELVLHASILSNFTARFPYLARLGNEIIDDDSHQRVTQEGSRDFKRVRSLIGQIKLESSNNPFVKIICDLLYRTTEIYEQKVSILEQHLTSTIAQLYTYEYITRQNMASGKGTAIDSNIAFESENDSFQICYDSILAKVINLLGENLTINDLNSIMDKMARLAVSSFKRLNGVVVFFDLGLSIDINNEMVRLCQLLCEENSVQLSAITKDYFKRFPILLELVDMKREYKSRLRSGHGHVPEVELEPVPRSSDADLSPDMIPSLQLLILDISRSFKRFELYERELQEPNLPRIQPSYYEFKFPEVFNIYMQVLKDVANLDNVLEDPFCRLVFVEVLKYQHQPITPECWDLQLHNLCKLLFGHKGHYEPLQNTVYHRLAVYLYATSQSVKRTSFALWMEATVKKKESRALISLYEKSFKTRMLSTWVEKFIHIRSLQVEASKYNAAFLRNSHFTKWLNKKTDLQYMDKLADRFLLTKFLLVWVKKRLHLRFQQAVEEFELHKKLSYFAKFNSHYSKLKKLDQMAKVVSLRKLFSHFTDKNEILQCRQRQYKSLFVHRYFNQWKSALVLVRTLKLTRFQTDSILRNWMFQNWIQRTHEHQLCMQFQRIRDEELARNYLYSMLLLKENLELAKLFERKQLLVKAIKRLKLVMAERLFEKLQATNLCKRTFQTLKRNALCTMMRGSKDLQMVSRILDQWSSKAVVLKQTRQRQLDHLCSVVSDKFRKSQKNIYLKYFLYRWEVATISVLEKEELLLENYEGFIVDRTIEPNFAKWRSATNRIVDMNQKAEKFEKDLHILNYFGVMLDKADEINYLNEVGDEFLQVIEARYLSQILKKWSLKALKLRSAENLILEFHKRSDLTLLLSFLNMWRDVANDKLQLKTLGADESFTSSVAYSPLLHRYPKKVSSVLGLNSVAEKNTTSTPLVIHNRNVSLSSPRRRMQEMGSTRRQRSPRSVRTPGKTGAGFNSGDSFKKTQAQELRSRFLRLRLTPSTTQSSISPPPSIPSFVEAQNNAVREFESATNQESDFFTAQFSQTDEIPEPRISPSIALLQRLRKGYPISLYEQPSPSIAELAHTRSSSLTFVDPTTNEESSSENGDDYYTKRTNIAR